MDLEDEEILSIFAGPLSNDTLPCLQRLCQDSTKYCKALEILADGSRNEDRREAYGQTGLLDYLLEVQASSQYGCQEALRAIANACADNGKAHDVSLDVFSSFDIC